MYVVYIESIYVSDRTWLILVLNHIYVKVFPVVIAHISYQENVRSSMIIAAPLVAIVHEHYDL